MKMMVTTTTARRMRTRRRSMEMALMALMFAWVLKGAHRANYG